MLSKAGLKFRGRPFASTPGSCFWTSWPGRKEVIWLTAAFPFELIPENRDVSDAELLASLPNIQQKSVGTLSAGAIAEQQRQAYGPEIREAAVDLSASQVAIYPVDVRGLLSGME